jgi:rhodanese-related sulfurtransferase
MCRSDRRDFLKTGLILGTGVALKGLDFSPNSYPKNNKRSAEYGIISGEALLKKINEGEKFVLIDCRPDDEYRAGHIRGAANISMDSYSFGKDTVIKAALQKILDQVGRRMDFVLIDTELGEEYMPRTKLLELVGHLPLDRNDEVVLYCRKPTCTRSPMAARWAASLGYCHLIRYEGGWEDWTAKEYPVEKSDDSGNDE